jgi:hypothetical protein
VLVPVLQAGRRKATKVTGLRANGKHLRTSMDPKRQALPESRSSQEQWHRHRSRRNGRGPRWDVHFIGSLVLPFWALQHRPSLEGANRLRSKPCAREAVICGLSLRNISARTSGRMPSGSSVEAFSVRAIGMV